MDETKQIIILGEKWKIVWGLTSEDDEDSQCYPWRREIHIKEKLEYPEGIIRHEIIHAFLFESGLGFNVENRPLGQSETMVDWFALQYPKIKKVFEELGVEEGQMPRAESEDI